MNPDLPDAVAEHPLLQEDAWLALREDGVEPLYQSELVTTEQGREEFLVGAWLLGLLDSIQPQMLRVSDALGSGKLMNAVIMPRRSSKTTTLFCILLGRCYLRPVHMAGFTLLTTQKKTAERYRLDIYGPISRRWPDADTRPVKLLKGSGTERVEFTNGSVLAVLSPDGEAIRSGAYDTLLADESGEASLERWQDVIGAVIPAFDTRPEGQLILAGTAGDYRGESEFWKTLNDPDAGVIRYTLPDDIDPEELLSWEPTEEHPLGHARELVESMHPGLYGLTTLDRIKNSYSRLGVLQFTREYFGIFGAEGSNVALISQPKWLEAGLELSQSKMPDAFVLSAYVHRDSLWASVGAAWKDKKGKTHVCLLWHQEGVQGFGKRLLLLSRKHKRPIVFDSWSNATEVELRQLREARPRPVERPVSTRDIARSAVHFMNLLNHGQLVHYNQEELNGAAEIAVKRVFNTGTGWAFGLAKGNEALDITGLEAVAMAAYLVDEAKGSSTNVKIDWFE